MKSDVTATSMAERKPKKELSHIELHPGENGGATATHHFTHYLHQTEGPHIFSAGQGRELMAHVGKHLGMEMGTQKAAAGKSKGEISGSEAEEV